MLSKTAIVFTNKIDCSRCLRWLRLGLLRLVLRLGLRFRAVKGRKRRHQIRLPGIRPDSEVGVSDGISGGDSHRGVVEQQLVHELQPLVTQLHAAEHLRQRVVRVLPLLLRQVQQARYSQRSQRQFRPDLVRRAACSRNRDEVILEPLFRCNNYRAA